MKRKTRDEQIRDLARDTHGSGGHLEIDDNAIVSEGDDNGCYVAAWVWLSFSGTKFDKENKNVSRIPSRTK